MDKDYENFLGRMRSCEDVMDFDKGTIEDSSKQELEHSAKSFVDDSLIFIGNTIVFEL